SSSSCSPASRLPVQGPTPAPEGSTTSRSRAATTGSAQVARPAEVGSADASADMALRDRVGPAGGADREVREHPGALERPDDHLRQQPAEHDPGEHLHPEPEGEEVLPVPAYPVRGPEEHQARAERPG